MEKILFSAEASRFKMVIYLRDKRRLVYYSVVSEDKKGAHKSIEAMERRLLANRYRKLYNTAMVYDNETGQVVAKFVRGVREI